MSSVNGGDKIKGSSSQQEDATLIKLEEQDGPRNWSVMSTDLPGRSGKSCRLRWWNQLSPEVQHRPFTPTEDAKIVQARPPWQQVGYCCLAVLINAIKNHWNSTLRRKHVIDITSTSSESISVSNSDSEAKRQYLIARA
ncbi:hypothetical protein OIU78_005391 [Salix suchowensis]|nr:hypothetical protein OIU78_005391 [Salix suchowensis]